MSKRIKRKYTAEFKLSAINMVINSDKSVAQIASDLGVNVTTLYTWVNHAKSPNDADKHINHEAMFDEKPKGSSLDLTYQISFSVSYLPLFCYLCV